MNYDDKRHYQLMVVRAVQNRWEKAVIYEDVEMGYEEWLNRYLNRLEQTDQFEQLQAFIDYHTDDENIRKR